MRVGSRGFNRLTPISDALAALAAVCGEIVPAERSIENAAERIVASSVRTSIALPPSPIALRDGWAVSAQDTLGASCYAPSSASEPPRLVACGEALPDHADALLPLSGVNALSCPMEILSIAAPGEGVRAKGSDFTIGEAIVSAGTKLRPDHIPLFYLAGIDKVSLRIPRVAVAVCGDSRNADRIATWLAALCVKEGAECRLHAIELTVTGSLTKVMSQSPVDFIILIDVLGSGYPIAETVTNAGEVFAHGIAMRPGEATGYGVLHPWGKSGNLVPVVFVSERIENVLSAWLLLVRPSLRRLAAATGSDHGEVLSLKRKIVSSSGISDLVLARRTSDPENGAVWDPLAIGDIPWVALALADAWLLVPSECEGYAAGGKICAQFL